MLHYILVKWNPDVEKQSAAQAVRALYAKAAEIAGVRRAEIRENITPRDNRYDLMIVLEMDGEALSGWDQSQLHRQWKQKYGAQIEKKCIFDCAGGMEESI